MFADMLHYVLLIVLTYKSKGVEYYSVPSY